MRYTCIGKNQPYFLVMGRNPAKGKSFLGGGGIKLAQLYTTEDISSSISQERVFWQAWATIVKK